MSAQPCGCDPDYINSLGAKGYVCLMHREMVYQKTQQNLDRPTNPKGEEWSQTVTPTDPTTDTNFANRATESGTPQNTEYRPTEQLLDATVLSKEQHDRLDLTQRGPIKSSVSMAPVLKNLTPSTKLNEVDAVSAKDEYQQEGVSPSTTVTKRERLGGFSAVDVTAFSDSSKDPGSSRHWGILTHGDAEKLSESLRQHFTAGHPAFTRISLDEMILHAAKNTDYAKGGPPLGNFERVAAILALYPNLQLSDQRVVALVYAMKQLDAVLWGMNSGIVHKVEGANQRLQDVSVYAKLVMCMNEDKE